MLFKTRDIIAVVPWTTAIVPKPATILTTGSLPIYWATLNPTVAPPAEYIAAAKVLIPSLLKLVLIFGWLTLTVAPVPTLIVLFLSSVTFNVTSYILFKSNSILI